MGGFRKASMTVIDVLRSESSHYFLYQIIFFEFTDFFENFRTPFVVEKFRRNAFMGLHKALQDFTLIFNLMTQRSLVITPVSNLTGVNSF